jgi:hypothetical protein
MFSIQGLMFSNVTNLTSLASALADVLHPTAYLEVYPVRVDCVLFTRLPPLHFESLQLCLKDAQWCCGSEST